VLDDLEVRRVVTGTTQQTRGVFVAERPGLVAVMSGVVRFFLRRGHFVAAEGDVFLVHPDYLPRVDYLALSSAGAEFVCTSFGAWPVDSVTSSAAHDPYRPRRNVAATSVLRVLLAVGDSEQESAHRGAVERCLRGALSAALTPDNELVGPYATDERIVPVLNYMHEHFDEHINLDVLADLAGYSRFHFVRYFTEVVGDAPHRYLTTLRVDVATRWLDAGTDVTVAFIARGCGFPSSTAFTRAFRQYVGVTPSEYRDRHRAAS
jgi:AraC-like DNA-binding protein